MGLDIDLFNLLNGLAGTSRVCDVIVIFFASIVPYIVILVAGAMIIFSDKHWKARWYDFFFIVISGLVTRGILTPIIRALYARPRPFLAMPSITTLIEKSTEASFPSGHAMLFFALAIALYFTHRKWAPYFIIVAVLIGIARVIAGVHYPSDIIAGALLAWVTVVVIRKYLLPEKLHQD